MNPMISNFNSNDSGKMSSSEDDKIDLLDKPKKIKKKLGKAYCEEGNINCGLIEFVKYVLFPLCEFQKKTFLITRKEEYGGDYQYTNYDDLEKDFIEKKLHPGDLKKSITEWLVNLLEPVREHFNNEYLENITNSAY